MARYRNEQDDDRDYYAREDRMRRENFGSYDESYGGRRQFENDRRSDLSRGRFGERAEYSNDEPRYANYTRERFGDSGRLGDSGRRSPLYDNRGDLSSTMWRDRDREYYNADRSRLRCREIMTRDLVVATRATTLTEIARMMKQEDVGVIPVVDYDEDAAGNGKTDDRRYEGRNYTRGKLIGLITDRDIVVRSIADNKDCASTRSEDIMSVDAYTANPNDRVVDVIRKMGDKQVRRIPVTNDNGYLVGMISMADIALETRQDHELSEALEDISKGSSFWNRLFG